MQKRVDSLAVGLETFNQVVLETDHGVGQDAGAVQKVADHHGLENVQLELAAHAANSGSDVVTHDLGADHSQSLTLGGVDFSRHDRGTGLVLGQDQLTQTATGTGTKVTDILSNLEERASQGVQGAGGLNDGVVGGQDLELVRGGDELGTSKLGDLGSDSLVEALESVQTGTDGSTTLSKLTEVRKSGLHTLDVAVQLGNVARELLAQSKRSGVLQVSTADLDDLGELVDLLLQGVPQAAQGRQKAALELEDSSNVHDGGEGVVGGGGHVDVVVGVDGLLASHLSTQDLNGTVGDDLVGVHVGLSAGTGLPHNQREVVNELEVGDLSSSLLDSLADLGVLERHD